MRIEENQLPSPPSEFRRFPSLSSSDKLLNWNLKRLSPSLSLEFQVELILADFRCDFPVEEGTDRNDCIKPPNRSS